LALYTITSWNISSSNMLSFRCSAEMSMGEKNILKSEMGLQLNIVF
jgi:hypothetical protein